MGKIQDVHYGVHTQGRTESTGEMGQSTCRVDGAKFHMRVGSQGRTKEDQGSVAAGILKVDCAGRFPPMRVTDDPRLGRCICSWLDQKATLTAF